MKVKHNRRSFKYRIFHWFNTLTFNDVRRAKRFIFAAIDELLTVLLLLFVIFILPSFFY